MEAVFSSVDVEKLDELVEKFGIKKILWRRFRFQGKGKARYMSLFLLLVRKNKRRIQVPSDEIAKIIQISQRQVFNIIKQLSEAGLIEKWKRAVNGKQGRTNIYEVSSLYEEVFKEFLSDEENELLNQFLDKLLELFKIDKSEENREKVLKKAIETTGLSEKEIVENFKQFGVDYAYKLIMNNKFSTYIRYLKGEIEDPDKELSEFEKKKRELLKRLQFG